MVYVCARIILGLELRGKWFIYTFAWVCRSFMQSNVSVYGSFQMYSFKCIVWNSCVVHMCSCVMCSRKSFILREISLYRHPPLCGTNVLCMRSSITQFHICGLGWCITCICWHPCYYLSSYFQGSAEAWLFQDGHMMASSLSDECSPIAAMPRWMKFF